jgi:hypothetical protein
MSSLIDVGKLIYREDYQRSDNTWSHYFATTNKIIDSSKDHQWENIIVEQDIHTVTRHHHTGHFLIAKGVKESQCFD